MPLAITQYVFAVCHVNISLLSVTLPASCHQSICLPFESPPGAWDARIHILSHSLTFASVDFHTHTEIPPRAPKRE